MDADKLFSGKYLRAADAEPSLTLTIFKVEPQEKMKNHDGVEEEKPVVYFREVQKGMVLNFTNKESLKAMFGQDTDDWINQRVTLGTELITAFGETKPALRFKTEEIKFDRQALLKAYEKLYEEACKVEVEDVTTYIIDPKTITDAELMEMGKELRSKTNAAKAFM